MTSTHLARTLLTAWLVGLAACPAADDDVDDPVPGQDAGPWMTAADAATTADTADPTGDATEPTGDAPDADDGCGRAPICGEPCGNLEGPEAGCCPCWGSYCDVDAEGAPFALACAASPGQPGVCYEPPRTCDSACIYLGGSDEGVARCLDEVDTCEEIEAEYLAMTDALTFSPCATADECEVLPGHCEIGLGGCWLPRSFGGSVPALDDLAARWVALQCPPGPGCDCTNDPPAPVCRSTKDGTPARCAIQ